MLYIGREMELCPFYSLFYSISELSEEQAANPLPHLLARAEQCERRSAATEPSSRVLTRWTISARQKYEVCDTQFIRKKSLPGNTVTGNF